MANVFKTLTIAAADLTASTTTDDCGPEKTFTISGPFTSPILVEISQDGSTWGPILKVDPPGGEPIKYTLVLVAAHIRARKLTQDPSTVTVTISAATSTQNAFATMTAPSESGTGAAITTSEYGQCKTIVVGGGDFTGTLIVEGSADSGSTYDLVAQFQAARAGGQLEAQTIYGAYTNMRVRRVGCGSPAGTPSVAIGASPIEPLAFEATVADWPLGTVRYFLLSGVQGDDNNQGWSDTTPDVTKAVKTWARLSEIIPRVGANRKAVVLIEEGSYAEALTIHNFIDYDTLLFRATGTGAGAVAFDNSAADKVYCGAAALANTEANGYKVSGTPTAWQFECIKYVDDGAPGFAAEPALLTARIRFAEDTATAALQNKCYSIWKHTSDAIYTGQVMAATPAVGDRFYIEVPGAYFTSISVYYSRRVKLVGIGATASALSIGDYDSSVFLSFVKSNSAWASWCSLYASGSYTDESSISRTVGSGVMMSGNLATANKGDYGEIFDSTITGIAIVWLGGFFVLSSATVVYSDTWMLSVGSPVIGRRSFEVTTKQKLRLVSSSGTCFQTNSDVTLDGVVMEALSAVDCISASTANGRGKNLIHVKDVDFYGDPAYATKLVNLSAGTEQSVRWGTGNTATNAAIDFYMYGGVQAQISDLSYTDLTDARGNRIFNATMPAHVVSNFVSPSMSAPIFTVVQRLPNSTVPAKADGVTNSSGVFGIAISRPGNQAIAMSAAIPVLCAPSPTMGDVLYLSEATAGMATPSAPASAGTNQLLKLGHAIHAYSDGSGIVIVAWNPDLVPTAA